MKGGVGELGGPTPTWFSAITRSSYSVPSIRSVTFSSRSVRISLLTFIQRELDVSRRSTWYPTTGEPPSNAGGCHVNVHVSLVTSETSGDCGGPGGSVKRKPR